MSFVKDVSCSKESEYCLVYDVNEKKAAVDLKYDYKPSLCEGCVT